MIVITRKPIQKLSNKYKIKLTDTKEEILQRVYDRLSPVKIQLYSFLY